MAPVAEIGANRGIGLGLVQAHADSGHEVHATVRDPGTADIAKKVPGKVKLHPLEVRDAVLSPYGESKAALNDSFRAHVGTWPGMAVVSLKGGACRNDTAHKRHVPSPEPLNGMHNSARSNCTGEQR